VVVCIVTDVHRNCYTLLYTVDRAAVIDPIARYLSRIAIFAYLTSIRRPLDGIKLEWCNYQMVRKIKDVFICFNLIHEGDGQTDGRTNGHCATA